MAAPQVNLPVIELARLEDSADALRGACHAVGFFYLDTGSTELETRALAAASQFFALPMAEKRKLDNTASPHWRGYIGLGGENTQGKPDWREQVEFGAEKEALDDATAEDRPLWARLIGPNVWPDEQHPGARGFRAEVEAVVEQLTGIGARLMRAIALALGLHPDAFQHCFQPWPNIQYKVARYLCPEDETSLSGVGAHSDSGMLTLLIQDGTGGLEAQLADGGAWIAVPPRKGMLVVNLGEMLQVATQGYFLATVHRVVNTKGKQRISFPFFYNAALSSPMRLCSAHGLPFQISDGLPWERVSRDRDARNWRDDQNQMLDIYGDNALKSLVSCP